MIGIVCIIHGQMAEGILDTVKFLMGDEVTQLESLALQMDDNPTDFRDKLDHAIKQVDTGEGVIVLADLFGGTPANQSMYLLSDKVKVITGMNLPMLMELLLTRNDKLNDDFIDKVIDCGKQGICCLNNIHIDEEDNDE